MGAWTLYNEGGQAFAPTSKNVILLRMNRQSPASLTPDQLRQLLLAVATKHDRRAFAELFGHLAPRIKSYFMRSGMTAPASEELVQETMLAVWRKASFFDPAQAGVSTWVYTIARNQRIDFQRREGRQTLLSTEVDPTTFPDPLKRERQFY